MRQSTLTATVEEILHHAHMEAEEKARLLAAYESRDRAAASEKHWRMRKCPGCGAGLKLKAMLASTLFYCAGCSFTHEVPWLMDEARGLDEAYLPGVTAQRRPTVIFDASGKIKKVVGA